MGHLKTRYEYGDDISAIAGEALVGARLVELMPGGKGTQGKPRVRHTTGPAVFVYGANAHNRAVGDDATITRRATVMLLEAHGAIAENQLVMPAALGRVQADDGATAGRTLVGRALHAVTTQGQMVWCIVDFPIK